MSIEIFDAQQKSTCTHIHTHSHGALSKERIKIGIAKPKERERNIYLLTVIIISYASHVTTRDNQNAVIIILITCLPTVLHSIKFCTLFYRDFLGFSL